MAVRVDVSLLKFSDSLSGYNCNLVHPLPPTLKCARCQLVMRNPVQTECGHRFCEACVVEILKQPTPSCPREDCKKLITPSRYFRDRACQKEILHLDIKCGCEWVGKIKHLEAHLIHCVYCEVKCEWCSKRVHKSALASHQQVDCQMKPEKCARCSKVVPFQQMQNHVCPVVIGNTSRMAFEPMDDRLKMLIRQESVLLSTTQSLLSAIEKLEWRLLGIPRNHWPGAHFVEKKLSSANDSVFGSRSSLQSEGAELEKGLKREHSLVRFLDRGLRLQLAERALYKGILLWKIDDFARCAIEAVNSMTTSLYSSPFYSNQQGYEMCIRLYLNGDGLSKGTHMSLNFYLMDPSSGAHTAQPLKRKVLFSLLTGMDERNIKFHHQINVEIEQREALSCGGCLFPLKQVYKCVVNDTLTICAQLSPTAECIEAPDIIEEEEISEIGLLTHEVECLREQAVNQQHISMAYEEELKMV